MQSGSTRLLPAPLCSQISGVYMGPQHNATLVYFSTGEAVLASSVAAGATAVDTVLALGTTGFQTGDTAIISYGQPHEEEFVATVTDGNTLTVAASGTLKRAHKAGARIINKAAMRPIRPGSVAISRVGATSPANPVAVDDAKGNIIGLDSPAGSVITGKVDYSNGAITATWAVVTGLTGLVTAAYDVLADAPDLADIAGRGFHANALTAIASAGDKPDFVTITNLGSGEVGVFVELTRNNGASFFMRGFGSALKLKGQASDVIRVPAGTGPYNGGIRIRAGVKPGSLSTLDPHEAQIIKENMISCDFGGLRNWNGGGR